MWGIILIAACVVGFSLASRGLSFAFLWACLCTSMAFLLRGGLEAVRGLGGEGEAREGCFLSPLLLARGLARGLTLFGGIL